MNATNSNTLAYSMLSASAKRAIENTNFLSGDSLIFAGVAGKGINSRAALLAAKGISELGAIAQFAQSKGRDVPQVVAVVNSLAQFTLPQNRKGFDSIPRYLNSARIDARASKEKSQVNALTERSIASADTRYENRMLQLTLTEEFVSRCLAALAAKNEKPREALEEALEETPIPEETLTP